jgi:hypothetical protein
VYGHTGWREVNGRWVYLHAGGGIGADGPVEGIEVQLPQQLARFAVPQPPSGDQLVCAVRASLKALDVAPLRLTASVFGAAYRAPLGSADFGVHLSGESGKGKTELATLGQQHYGAGMDSRHVPASWLSTGNSLEAQAFAAKDAFLLVDDFKPGGTTLDMSWAHKEYDRLLRAQGNASGRSRCQHDGKLRAEKCPRGLIVTTGEEVPHGHSLRARVLVNEVAPGEVNWESLTDCQHAAADGLYAQAMAGYLQWLAPQYEDVRRGLRAEVVKLREKVEAEGMHARTPGILADLAVGWRYWLMFARTVGAIDEAEQKALAEKVWVALLAAGGEQAALGEAAEPCSTFLRLLAGALAGGRCHVDSVDGQAPPVCMAWGWRENGVVKEPLGPLVGWLDDEQLYLEPEIAYAEVQRLASSQGEALPVGPRTLWKRMREQYRLASWDENRKRNTIRRTLGGDRGREVLHLRAATLSPPGDRPQRPQGPHSEDLIGNRVDGRAGYWWTLWTLWTVA